MILGIGTDIANLERIKEVLKNHGERFAEKYFSEEEIARGETKETEKDRIAYFAKHWAAKEAFVKALGWGFRDGIYPKDVMILNDTKNKPYIKLEGGVKETFDKLIPEGYSAKIHISLSDDVPSAIAFVVIEAQKI